jgi:hypothetical protein
LHIGQSRVFDDGKPLLTLEAGVPFNGCVLAEDTAFGAAPDDGCAVTMASLLGGNTRIVSK